MKLWTPVFVLSLVSIFYLGCSHSGSHTSLNQDPVDDAAYIQDYEKATRDQQVIVNFESRYTITATHLSPEFRRAFGERYQRIYETPQPFLEETTTRVGFFVTFFGNDRDANDLTNDQLWSVQLVAGDRRLKPILIKRLDHKARWRPFFLAVNNWTQEFLVLFDLPSMSMDEKLVNKPRLSLNIANADARVRLDW